MGMIDLTLDRPFLPCSIFRFLAKVGVLGVV